MPIQGGKDAALYFKPKNVEKASEAILSLTKSKKLQEKLIENCTKQMRKFGTAFDSACQVIDLLNKIKNKMIKNEIIYYLNKGSVGG